MQYFPLTHVYPWDLLSVAKHSYMNMPLVVIGTHARMALTQVTIDTRTPTNLTGSLYRVRLAHETILTGRYGTLVHTWSLNPSCLDCSEVWWWLLNFGFGFFFLLLLLWFLLWLLLLLLFRLLFLRLFLRRLCLTLGSCCRLLSDLCDLCYSRLIISLREEIMNCFRVDLPSLSPSPSPSHTHYVTHTYTHKLFCNILPL